jgi:hypothetical protein
MDVSGFKDCKSGHGPEIHGIDEMGVDAALREPVVEPVMISNS